MTTELSLFPLHVVLFFGMVLPLHIFEERHKTMIQPPRGAVWETDVFDRPVSLNCASACG